MIMDKLVNGIILTPVIEDITDIDPDYPTTDELNNMDSFLSHYTRFADKINGRLLPSDTTALYAVYIHTTWD
jgi:hypothetical protein